MTVFPSPPLDTSHAREGHREFDLASPCGHPRLRADAARNRARLLEAAFRLVAEAGVANLTMEAVAAAAQVGKGTVFRRFGDRLGLLQALLAHCEEWLQAAFMTGPPPLGPDAPALERLHAFGPAVIRHQHTHGDIYLASRTDPTRNYTVPAHRLRLTHVAMLLRQTGADSDIDLLAQTLLGYLDPALVHHLLTRRGMPVERLEAGWCDLVGRVTGTAPSGTATSGTATSGTATSGGC